MDEIFSVYIEELKENLISLNEALLELKNQCWDQDTINRLFRVAHTIKGNSAAVGFYRIEKVMHDMEDILFGVRDGSKKLTVEIVAVLFECHDFLEDCVHVLLSDGNDHLVAIDSIMLTIKKAKTVEELQPSQLTVSSQENELGDHGATFANDDELLLICGDQDVWELISDNVKRGFTAYKVDVTIDDESAMKSVRAWMVMQKIDSESSCLCYMPAKPTDELVRSGEYVFDGQVIRMIILAENKIDELLQTIRSTSGVSSVESTLITAPDIERVLGRWNQAGASEAAASAEAVASLELEAASVLTPGLKQSAKKEASSSPSPSKQQDNHFIRIPVGKVDHLMDMLGELTIIHSQLEQHASTNIGGDMPLLNNLARMAKIIKVVQTVSMSLRLVEIRPTLLRLTRIIRDTAVELDKKVNISLEGEEIELDRGAADKLFDPLMHLVRNAVSHGIEPEEERIRVGKSPQGQISIKAYNKRGDVYIEISDDGKGIDTRKILAKAIRLNMADESIEYSEDQILRFIFVPGFSTQEEVNNISGRGVGMNVVESEIKKLGGRIEIINDFGRGCTFRLRIPTNLAVLNGTIAEVSGGRYIIPTLFIREFFIVEEANKISIQGSFGAIRMRENIVPIVRLEQLFGLQPEQWADDCRNYIILELDNKLLALPVAKIWGRQEVVTKPLNDELAHSGLFSGASIMGDGRVSLILDVEAIFKEIL